VSLLMTSDAILSRLDSLQELCATCVQRLQAGADTDEALHDLRVCLRRLRGGLRLLTKRRERPPLFRRAADVLQQSGVMRDQAVLVSELQSHGEVRAARRRRQRLERTVCDWSSGDMLPSLLSAWADWRRSLTVSQLHAPLRAGRRWRRELARAQARLGAQLQQPAPALHKVRLAIKQWRYQLEAMDPPGAPPHLLALLLQTQDLLGEWHDRQYWLACAETEADLRSCCVRWLHEVAVLEARLAPLLVSLRLSLSAPACK